MGAPTTATAYKDRRVWLTVFGAFEAVIGLFFLAMAAFTAVLLRAGGRPDQPTLPLASVFFVCGMYVVIAAVFVTLGIGSIRARNWARIGMIVVSSFWLISGMFGLVVTTMLMPAILKQQSTASQGRISPEVEHSVLLVTGVFMTFTMVVLPLVFLLFNCGKNVRATCLATSSGRGGQVTLAPPPATSRASRPLLPILLALWFGVTAISMIPSMFLIPGGPVLLICGFALTGKIAWIVTVLVVMTYAYCSYAFFKLIREGWVVAIAVSAFWLLSGAVTALRGKEGEVLSQMPSSPFFHPDARFVAAVWILSLLISGVLLALTLYSGRHFRPRS